MARHRSFSFEFKRKVGGPIDWLIRVGILKRLSKSVAFVARRN